MNPRCCDGDDLAWPSSAGTTRRRLLAGLGAVVGGLLALRGATAARAAEAAVSDKFAQSAIGSRVADRADEVG
jgi:hypothetical protein